MKKLAYGIGVVALIATAFIFAQGFSPPPAGFTPKFIWTGVRTVTGSHSVSVHCTNFHATLASTVHIEFVDFDGASVGSNTRNIDPGETRTMTGPAGSVFYVDDLTVPLTSDLDQGSVRVSAQGSKKLICSAHVLDITTSPPTFIHDLTTFNNAGSKF